MHENNVSQSPATPVSSGGGALQSRARTEIQARATSGTGDSTTTHERKACQQGAEAEIAEYADALDFRFP